MPTVAHPDFGSCRINEKGYPRINGGGQKDKYLHRAVFEAVAKRPPRKSFHIHHMNGKLCWCSHQLLEIQDCLHPANATRRDPYTGQFLTLAQYQRRYGIAS